MHLDEIRRYVFLDLQVSVTSLFSKKVCRMTLLCESRSPQTSQLHPVPYKAAADKTSGK
jgi:hypothetical protein